jgi:hypothetical protein
VPGIQCQKSFTFSFWLETAKPGLTGTDPEGASELGEDFISLLARNFNGKRWLAHSGIALKDLSGH